MALPQPNPGADASNIALLLWLYFLQGLPMGLSASVAMLMQARGAGFSEQANFALCSLPYSFKLLWAPAVDALFTTRFGLGRRKTWIVPTQFIIGIILCALAMRNETLFGAAPEASSGAVDSSGLAASFFVLYLLCATQDIAVDSWALVLLRPENVGYASTTNTIGQMLGITVGNSLLLALDSAEFSDAYVRAPLGLPPAGRGLVTVGGFMWGLGAVFAASTVLLWACKTEAAPPPAVAAQGAHAEGTAAAPGLPLEELEAAVGSASGSGLGGPSELTPASHHTLAPLSLAYAEGAQQQQQQQEEAPVAPAVQRDAAEEEGAEGGAHTTAAGRRGRRGSHSRGATGSGARRRTPTNAGAVTRAQSRGGGPAYARAGGGDAAGGTAKPLPREGASESSCLDLGPAASAGQCGPQPAGGAAAAEGSLGAALASLGEAYGALWRVLCLAPVQRAAAFLLTCKVAFTAVDSSTSLVLQSKGFSPATLSSFSALSTPVLLLAQVAVSRLTAGPRPLSTFLAAYPLRLACGGAFLVLLYGGGLGLGVPSSAEGGGGLAPPGWAASAAVLLLSNAHGLVQTAMFLAMMSFFARVSDPRMGGTYMTLLNTLANLGSAWPQWAVMQGIGLLSARTCVPRGSEAEGRVAAAGWLELLPPGIALAREGGLGAAAAEGGPLGAACPDAASAGLCVEAGGRCVTTSDGYLLAVLLSTGLGLAWWACMREPLRSLEALPVGDWLAAPAAKAKEGGPAAAEHHGSDAPHVAAAQSAQAPRKQAL